MNAILEPTGQGLLTTRRGNGATRCSRAAGAALCLWLLLLVGPGPEAAVALDPGRALTQYIHDVWQTDDGLPQNSVRAVAQTRDGYLWLGTEEGLVRFDGVRFSVFDKSNTAGLRSNAVTALFGSRDGSLWIGTFDGGLTRFADGQFTSYGKREGLANGTVWAVHEDRSGSLWIGTDGGGLNRFAGGRFTSYTTKDGLPSERVTALHADRDGVLWIGTVAGLCRLKDGVFATYTTKDGLPSDQVLSLWADREQSLWIGTRGAGLARYREGRITVPAATAALSRAIVRSLFEDRAGNLWIGATGGGLHRLAAGRLVGYTTEQGLSNDNVASIFEDREGVLWVGTDGGGLNRLADGKLTAFTAREGLSNDMVWCVHEDRSGGLWFGTFGGGLNRLKDGRLTVFTTKDGLSDDRVWSVYEDSHGDLWIGTFSGLDRLRNGTLRAFTTKDGLSSNNVMSIYEDRHGDLWFGTFGGGLNRYRDGKFTVYGQREGLANPNVIFVRDDRAGNLWVGTFGGGLHRLVDGRFTVYTTRDGLSSDTLTSMYEDEAGALWIGTLGGGLNRLRDGRFVSFTRQVGLFDDTAYHIAEDDEGRLWMASNKGIFRVAKKELDELAAGRRELVTSVAYGKADGMRSVECNSGAGTKTRDGRIWFPTIRGAVVVDPAHLPRNERAPDVVIEGVVADDQPLSGPGYVLAPGTERLEIHYTASSLVAPERVAFKYQLEGTDTDWVNAGPRRVAYYTRIPPGRHRFQVVGSNDDGVWSPAGAAIELTVQPLFHQTIWFYAVCLLGATLVVAGGHSLRVKRLKERQGELKRLVEERTAALRQSHLELQQRSEELEQANRHLQRLSYLDELTGVANRRFFEEALRAEVRRAQRDRGALSALMIDLDFFKDFNDACGHQSGDKCLKRVADTLGRELNRAGDLLARWGGEEFVIILPGTTEAGALVMAEQLRRRVEELDIRHERSAVGEVVTISVGVATAYPQPSFSDGELVAAADQALYAAKQGGRNQVRVWVSPAPGAA